MKGHYVHVATLRMADDGDSAAPGAAITVALCGSWEHPPPCPLAAHQTAAQQDGGTLQLRTVFTAEPAQEGEVRRRIGAALSHGTMADPDGVVSHWTLLGEGAGELTEQEQARARRIAGT